MSYIELLSAFWHFIKEIIISKNKKSKTTGGTKMFFIVLLFLGMSVMGNIYLFVRTFNITKEFMIQNQVNEQTIKTLSEKQPTVIIKQVTVPSSAPAVPKKGKPVAVKKPDRLQQIKDRFDKIRGKEE